MITVQHEYEIAPHSLLDYPIESRGGIFAQPPPLKKLSRKIIENHIPQFHEDTENKFKEHDLATDVHFCPKRNKFVVTIIAISHKESTIE